MADGDNELATLRHAIRRAGRSAERFWLALIVAPGLAFAGLVVVPRLIEAIAGDGLIAPATAAIFGLLWLGFAAMGIAVLPAYPLALLYRRACAARLRRQLAPLSNDQRERVLHPLEDDALPEAREIARLLLRDFRAAEVSPAPAPAGGRGNEPTA